MPTGEPAGSIPNVGLFARAIKGKLVRCSAIASEATQSNNKRLYFLNSCSAAERWAETAVMCASTLAISPLSVSILAASSS